MAPPGYQFGRAFVDALGAFSARDGISTKLSVQVVAALPVGQRGLAFTLRQANGPDLVVRDPKVLSNPGELAIENLGKARQTPALPSWSGAHGTNSGRIEVRPPFQIGNNVSCAAANRAVPVYIL